MDIPAPEVITVFHETENGVVFEVVRPRGAPSEKKLLKGREVAKHLISHKLVLFILLPLLVVFSLFQPVNISQADTNQTVIASNPPKPSLRKVDPRVLALQYYLATQDSPLQDYADKLVMYADSNNIDWKLLPSIAAVESKFGKVIPYGRNNTQTSYNAWGWGVYQGKSIYFSSWEDGISQVAVGLHSKYTGAGMQTPDQMNSHYSSNPQWGKMVDYYEQDLGNYYDDFEAKFGQQISSYNTQIDQINTKDQIPFTLVTP